MLLQGEHALGGRNSPGHTCRKQGWKQLGEQSQGRDVGVKDDGLGAKPCVHGPSSISVDASLDWNLDLTATQLWS